MSNPPWTELITMETLPNDDLKFLASLVGLPPIIYLMCYYQGSTYTVPKNATLRARREYVKKHYDGSKSSRLYLCRVCNFSENDIYKIISSRISEI